MRICMFILLCVALTAVGGSLCAEDSPTPPAGSPGEYPGAPPMTRPWGGGPANDNLWVYLRDMQDRINRIAEDSCNYFGPRPPLGAYPAGTDFSPSADVRETDKEIIVSCDIPGMDKEKIEVTYKDGDLIIRGKRESVKEESGSGFLARERSFGSFERVIPIEEDVKADEIKADYKNGVLTVILPKTETAKKPGTKIQIL
ncbi:MAG: Hsp20/alpha crystallin family protein [Candidatus Aureabacteria bacterium]|nr:Hsp20/alpha crystallin family protein [Candidatus Auribacterota bacterium]